MFRADERDTIFSRMDLKSGTKTYREYYERQPEKEEIDRRLRDAPPGRYADRPECDLIDETFGLIADLRAYVRGPVAKDVSPFDPGFMAGTLEQNVRLQGAELFSITESDPGFFYSIRGRGDRYGLKVDSIPSRTIVMGFPMNEQEVATAPDPRQSLEVVRTYLLAATTAIVAARYLRSAGYYALAHIDGESEIVLPLAARAAGLGELGRHGLLLTAKYGPRVRFSAVSTDVNLPLSRDSNSLRTNGKPAVFCEQCSLCASRCPGAAISEDPSRDGRFPRVDHEACYAAWKRFGTDCGVCLAVCPYSRVSRTR